MKGILIFTLLIISGISFSQTTDVDVIYLNNGNILTGTIMSFVPNEKLTLAISEGVNVDISMSDISKMEKKIIQNPTDGSNDSPTTPVKTVNEDAVTTKSEESEEKKERPFLQALGNFGAAVLNDAANSVEGSSEGTGAETEAETEGTEGTGTTASETATGGICFKNPNFYDRKVILVKQSNQKQYEIFVGLGQYGNPKTTCSEVIEAGVYDLEVYTTFTKKKVEGYIISVAEGETKDINLSENQYN